MIDIASIPVKWSECHDGQRAELVGCVLILSEYGDKSWHVSLPYECTGRMIDEQDDVHTEEEAKSYVERRLCDMLQARLTRAKENFKRYKALGLWDDA